MNDETTPSDVGGVPVPPPAEPPAWAPQAPAPPAEAYVPQPPRPEPLHPTGAAPPRTSHPVLAAVVTAFIAALIVGTFAGAAAGFFGATVALSRPGGLTGTGTLRVTGQTDEPVAAAAAAALPSVVNIDVSGSGVTGGTGGLPKGHPSVPVSGNGSGVAFRKTPDSGTYIITNNHVVADADSIVVTPVGGDRVKATLVGADPDTDIAVVKIPKALPIVELSQSSKVVVGELAVAIGSPFGLEHSVTSGVISALHRSLPPSSANTSGSSPLVDVIQTDASINPGNSGGALVDRHGALIGISSAIFSSTGSNDGIGFAIPVDTAMRVADELISTGKVSHPFLGIQGRTITDTLAKQKKLPVAEGALVVSIIKGTGAEKAGLLANDIIVRLDETRIRSMEDLVGAVSNATVGKTVAIKIYRGGKQTTVQMTVGVKPANL